MLSDVRYQDGPVSFLRGVVEGRVTTPLLLVGQDGTGRKFSVLETAREIFCSGDRTPSCPCVDCAQMEQGVHPDFLLVQPSDGKDIGVDAARGIIETLNTYPSQARLRLVLIDGADRLTMPAANALLKTLEEPPHTARLFLLAESASRVLPTIRSRCGQLYYTDLPEDIILEKLGTFEKDAAKALVLARLAEGSLGRAVQYWGSGKLALRDKALTLLTSALSRDVAGVFLLVDQLEKELPLTLRFLDVIVHDLLMLGVDSQRVVNTDLLPTLTAMRSPKPSTWIDLHRGIQAMLRTYRGVRIQLGFHTKTLLLETFVGG